MRRAVNPLPYGTQWFKSIRTHQIRYSSSAHQGVTYMKRYTLSIKAAEGGDDSKNFVGELAGAYVLMFAKLG